MYYGKRINGKLMLVDVETGVMVSLATLNEFTRFAVKREEKRKERAFWRPLKMGALV